MNQELIYRHAKIYSVRSWSRPDLIFIGGTTQDLAKRMYDHRKKGLGAQEVIATGDSYIELIEEYPCRFRECLMQRINHWIRHYENAEGVINTRLLGCNNCAYRTKCECGVSYKILGKSKHLTSEEHLKYEKSLKLAIEVEQKSVAENDVVGEFLNECCLSLNQSSFLELSKYNQKEWTTKWNDLNTKFSKWMEDNGESQPKRGVLSTRLEKLEYKKVKSNGNFVFQGLKFIPEEET
jgi:hypothetical protein